ncbi:MAG: tyrosine recombinase XerC [Oscillospiraceae bacterium]|nr:tyrosine recombinase XerC [Oscillospiraceae bacterium]
MKEEVDNIPYLLDDFLNYLLSIKGKSKNTVYGYKTDLALFFKYLKFRQNRNIPFEEVNIQNIDIDFIKNIKLSDMYSFIGFLEQKRNNGNYAKARKVAAIKSFYKYLYKKIKLIDENIAENLESPKISKRNPMYLSLDESKNLLNSIEGKFYERDLCMVTLFLNCGMRLSELCGINISNIKDDTLTVIGKGDKERTVYLNNSCLKILSIYLQKRKSIQTKIVEDSKDALFISKNYCRIDKRNVERIIKKYVIKAGLNSKLSPHKLRHTAATLMYKYGDVDIRSLQQILGHENVSTTQIYTHVDDEKLREAVSLNPLNI